eukprot:s5291_g6.t1
MRRVTAAICRAQYEAGRLFFLDSAPEQPTLEPDRDGIAPRPARCHYYDGPLRRRDRGRPANQEGDATHVPSASNFRPPTSLLTPINSNLAATTETYPGAFVDQLLTWLHTDPALQYTDGSRQVEVEQLDEAQKDPGPEVPIGGLPTDVTLPGCDKIPIGVCAQTVLRHVSKACRTTTKALFDSQSRSWSARDLVQGDFFRVRLLGGSVEVLGLSDTAAGYHQAAIFRNKSSNERCNCVLRAVLEKLINDHAMDDWDRLDRVLTAALHAINSFVTVKGGARTKPCTARSPGSQVGS